MYSTAAATATAALSDSQQHPLLRKLDLFRLQGRDHRGLAVLRVFPARYVSVEALTKYLEERILPRLEGREFAVVHVHTGVRRGENCPGISALRSIYDAVPVGVRRNLEAVYFVHPGLQARLFLATFGRLIFAGGLYEMIKYVNWVESVSSYSMRCNCPKSESRPSEVKIAAVSMVSIFSEILILILPFRIVIMLFMD